MSRNNLMLFGFILIKFVLQSVLIDKGYDLHRDEYLHLDQAHHLAWGYISVPPLTSWFSYLIYLLGNTEFWVKFFPTLFGSLTVVLVWKSVEYLGGNLYARSLAAVALIFSALARLNLLFQPNSFDILAWTFVFFCIVNYFQSERNKWLYWMGIGFGFGFLNKYTICFLAVGLVLGLLVNGERKLFKNWHFYGGLILATAIALPNIYWQWANDFPVIWHMRMLNKYQLVNIDRMDFLMEQPLFFIGSIFVLLAAIISLFAYKPFKKYRFLSYVLLITLLLFTYFRAKGYYAIGLYPIYLAFGSIYLAKILENGWQKNLKPIIILVPVGAFAWMVPLVFPVKAPENLKEVYARHSHLNLTRWEDGKIHAIPQDFADMLGWKELAEKVDQAYSKAPSDEYTLILCDNYGQAGAINFYAKTKDLEAFTINADYVNWIDLTRNITNIILVREAEEGITDREISLFGKTQEIGTITDPDAREFGTIVYLLSGAKTDINQILVAEIEEKRAETRAK